MLQSFNRSLFNAKATCFLVYPELYHRVTVSAVIFNRKQPQCVSHILDEPPPTYSGEEIWSRTAHHQSSLSTKSTIGGEHLGTFDSSVQCQSNRVAGSFALIQNKRGISYSGAWAEFESHEDGFSTGLAVAINYLRAMLPFEFVEPAPREEKSSY